MNLKSQKRIAAELLKVGINKVKFDNERLSDIKESITKADIRSLINKGAIEAKAKTGNSRGRIRKRIKQKRKGRMKGHGSRKGKKYARLSRKEVWINKARTQRSFITNLKNKGVISKTNFRNVYLKIKGGFFRSKRHIKTYLEEQKLIKNGNVKEKKTG